MILKVENLNKSLGGRPILKDVSFSVEKGQIFGYLGPNGAGKTTTIRLLLGLYKADSGSIIIDGQKLDAKAKAKVGFMLEEDGLYSELTLVENMKLYAGLYNLAYQSVSQRVDELLSIFDLQDEKNSKVGIFSRGMRKKAAFIRALLHDPQLLLLDEPFDGLDPDMQAVMRAYFIKLAKEQNKSIFMSSHNLYEVERLCRKIAVIRKGQIQLCDTIEHLKARIDNKDVSVEDIYFSVTGKVAL